MKGPVMVRQNKKKRGFSWNDLNGFALVVLALTATVATAAISEADYQAKSAAITEKVAAKEQKSSLMKWAFCPNPNGSDKSTDVPS